MGNFCGINSLDFWGVTPQQNSITSKISGSYWFGGKNKSPLSSSFRDVWDDFGIQLYSNKFNSTQKNENPLKFSKIHQKNKVSKNQVQKIYPKN